MATKTTNTAHPAPVPVGWNATACDAWATGQQLAAVQATLAALNQQTTKDPRLSLQAAYYLFLMKDIGSAAQILEHERQRSPGHREVLLNLGVTYRCLGKYAAAVELFEQVLSQDASHYVALDGLCICQHLLGNDDAASAAGTRALQLKDHAGQTAPPQWQAPTAHPIALAGQPGKRNVISFSLWGNGPAYLRGALRNVLQAHDVYPGWVLQFHVDPSVPADFLQLIQSLGAEVVAHPAHQPLRTKLCWRFAAANDPTVGRFLVRDADSVISTREALAVQAWCDSDRHFHVMRDWWSHTDLMLAGMWGGVAGVLPNLAPMLLNYRSPSAETPNIDQWFLRDQVWGMVRQSCLVHDRCFRPAGAQPFPGNIPLGSRHVGQDEFAAHGPWQARWLAPWIAAHPCLRAP